MAAITTSLTAQIDLHSHAVTDDYLSFVKQHHAEMDEEFPIPGWNVEKHLAFMDPAQLEAYMQQATEVGRVSMATEPGVLTLFSMQDKKNPAKIYILEVYADSAAYQKHIQTPHFRKYKESTAQMVRSLRLIAVDPLVPLTIK